MVSCSAYRTSSIFHSKLGRSAKNLKWFLEIPSGANELFELVLLGWRVESRSKFREQDVYDMLYVVNREMVIEMQYYSTFPDKKLVLGKGFETGKRPV